MIYFPYVPPEADLTSDVELSFERRGRYCESSFGVATRFPFAFLTKTRDVALAREILVYPAIEPPDELFQILPLVRGEWESFVRGRGSDLYRIREYMPEDSARHVNWKATAKSGSLKVREFNREDERKLCIVFDNPMAGLISTQKYERAVNLAASLAWHFSTQDAEVSFVISGHARGTDVHEFLARLAVIEAQADAQSRKDPQDGTLRPIPREDGLREISSASPENTTSCSRRVPEAVCPPHCGIRVTSSSSASRRSGTVGLLCVLGGIPSRTLRSEADRDRKKTQRKSAKVTREMAAAKDTAALRLSPGLTAALT